MHLVLEFGYEEFFGGEDMGGGVVGRGYGGGLWREWVKGRGEWMDEVRGKGVGL